MNNISPFIELTPNGIPATTGWSEGKVRITKENAEVRNDVGFVPLQGFCIVDADTPEAVEQVERVNNVLKLKVFSYETTRGRHFVYRTPEGKFFDSISSSVGASVFNKQNEGSKIDVKAGGRNGKNGYVRIKKNGKWRIEPDILLKSLESAPICPTVLLMPGRLKINLEDYKDGSRDHMMFAWLAKLRANGMTEQDFIKFAVEIKCLAGDPESFEETVEWAHQKWLSSNSMGTPINMQFNSEQFLDFSGIEKRVEKENKELQELNKDISREDVELALTFDKKKKMYDGVNDYTVVAKYVIEQTGLQRSAEDNQFWAMQMGEFKPMVKIEDFVRQFMVKEFGNIKPSVMNDIKVYVEAAIPLKKFNNDDFIVYFDNLILDVKKMKTVELDGTKMPQNRVPHNLIKTEQLLTTHKEEHKFLIETFKKWTKGRDDLTKQILERVGLSFIKYMGFEKAFFLLGVGSNGKSLFLDLLIRALGENNLSHEDLKELSDDRFSSSNLYGKIANINSDISAEIIEDPSLFKKIVSGDRISAAYKGIDKFSFKPFAKLWFGANNIPYPKEMGDSDAINRRIEVIPFLAVFDKSKVTEVEQIEFKEKLYSEKVIEVFIRMSIDAVHKALNSKFTVSQVSELAIEDFQHETNHLYGFIEECSIIDGETVYNAYKRYKDWTIKRGFKTLGQTQFMKKYKNATRNKGIQLYDIVDKKIKNETRHKIFIADDINEMEE